jgi:hypothetical protein
MPPDIPPGVDLTTLNSAGGDDTARPRRLGEITVVLASPDRLSLFTNSTIHQFKSSEIEIKKTSFDCLNSKYNPPTQDQNVRIQ